MNTRRSKGNRDSLSETGKGNSIEVSRGPSKYGRKIQNEISLGLDDAPFDTTAQISQYRDGMKAHREASSESSGLQASASSASKFALDTRSQHMYDGDGLLVS